MTTNTLDVVHPSDSDDSDYQYEVKNLAQQVYILRTIIMCNHQTMNL